MVSPKRQNRGILLPMTPATVFPEWMPILGYICGKSVDSSLKFLIFLMKHIDNLAISDACLFPTTELFQP